MSADTEQIINIWIARDKDGKLNMFPVGPSFSSLGYWYGLYGWDDSTSQTKEIDPTMFPEIEPGKYRKFEHMIFLDELRFVA